MLLDNAANGMRVMPMLIPADEEHCEYRLPFELVIVCDEEAKPTQVPKMQGAIEKVEIPESHHPHGQRACPSYALPC